MVLFSSSVAENHNHAEIQWSDVENGLEHYYGADPRYDFVVLPSRSYTHEEGRFDSEKDSRVASVLSSRDEDFQIVAQCEGGRTSCPLPAREEAPSRWVPRTFAHVWLGSEKCPFVIAKLLAFLSQFVPIDLYGPCARTGGSEVYMSQK